MEELQTEIIEKTFSAPIMSTDQKKEHVELMRNFLEKQKNLYFRLSLSDDPEAVEMKQRILESSKLLGYGDSGNMSVVFENMQKVIQRLKREAEVDK